MENASKALLIAGGILIALLIISLFLYAWSLFSEYQNSQYELANIEDTAKFNEQFTQYDRKDIKGYELISLVNKVIDYNYRKSSAPGAANDEKYKPITITIDLGNENKREDLYSDGTARLFVGNGTIKYTEPDTNNTLKKILQTATEIENRYGGSENATKIVKKIDSIFVTNITDEQVAIFNSLSTNTKCDKTNLNNEKINVYKYYEYVQFKKAIFESNSNKIDYDPETGRVIKMEFTFTGKFY